MNRAAGPVIDGSVLAEIFEARSFTMPAASVRAALIAAWGLRLVFASPVLFDVVLRLPLMDPGRARKELACEAARTSVEALEEFLAGLRSGRKHNRSWHAQVAPSARPPQRLRPQSSRHVIRAGSEFLSGPRGRVRGGQPLIHASV
ncbi:Rossmann-fold NAD(P)-binding domain-containing protein [Streptomyces vinaceus]|uniref:hypothetical protein n=1 Tax=Streptomyces vinaceus TaxID=1960 RepID=UPI00368007F0